MSTTAPVYWNQAVETLARPALESLQFDRLRRTVTRVWEKVDLYRRKLEAAKVSPDQLR